jgi:predicted Kef-type K+ transport protein
MDFAWVAVDVGDVSVLAVAFALGLLARAVGLPPLVGYLAAGFVLATQGMTAGPLIEKLSDLGITLLLFTVGLKIHIRTLVRPQVWAVATLHMLATTLLFAVGALAVAMSGLGAWTGLDARTALLIGFALSFSSTVFAVKALEDRGEMSALHGQVAIGILIMQDIGAVGFLALSSATLPSIWALLLLLLVPLRRVLTGLLQRIGHGELLVLYGFLLALGGAEGFELVALKGDLGALVLGVLIATDPRSDELAKRMLGFKDLFLVAFFLSIGLSGHLTLDVLLVGAAIAPLALLKAAGFFLLLTRSRLRARTALLASFNLANFSEFGLIVAAIGVSAGLLPAPWLAVIAIALSLSFVVAAVLNVRANDLYTRFRDGWRAWQTPIRLDDDRLLDIGDAQVAVIGVGGIGTGAYDELRAQYGDAVVGIDVDPVTVASHQAQGRRVLLGDPSDADFWDRVQATHRLDLVLLTLPNVHTTLCVLERLAEVDFTGRSAAIAKYPDEKRRLLEGGASTVYNIYTEAGSAFAGHVTAVADPT